MGQKEAEEEEEGGEVIVVVVCVVEVILVAAATAAAARVVVIVTSITCGAGRACAARLKAVNNAKNLKLWLSLVRVIGLLG